MIQFPVLESIEVQGYALYPGRSSDGLSMRFDRDLSVIVGANGLGKSTLLTIMFRTLTGPWDIPGALRDGDLGSASLEIKRLRTADTKTFADRVTDGARGARATMRVKLGDARYSISRSLSDLRLLEWTRDDIPQDPNESAFQEQMSAACGVWSFSDWILILRYVTFYMDDRQALFWDRNAQRQLLRSLFLSPAEAEKWVALEREVLELDSGYRNYRAIVNKETARVASLIEPRTPAESALREELQDLVESHETDVELQERLVDESLMLEERRSNANLERLRAIQYLDDQTRTYEHAKLVALSAQFPSTTDSALYIWNQVLADGLCLVCENPAPALKAQIDDRINQHHCVICDHQLDRNDESLDATPTNLSEERANRSWEELQIQRNRVTELEALLDDIREALGSVREELAQTNLRQSVTEQRISALRKQLPDDAEGYARDRTQLNSMQARIEEMAAELSAKASQFDGFMDSKTQSILSSAEQIKERFDRYSHLFLLGENELAWTAREETIGQSSYRIKFPAYELQLSRNDTGATSRRSAADDVSESQKEFIDLAFRMALIETASEAGATLVIDTPESSLDSVFSKRAAEVLSEYASTANNHLIAASNLTDGRLVPELIRETAHRDASWTLENLLEIARPTPALLELSAEYEAAYQKLTDDVSA